MKISVKVQSTEKRGVIYDKALSAHIFAPGACEDDEDVEEIELHGVIDSRLDHIFIVNEHCIRGWLYLNEGFTDRSEAEEYARKAMKGGTICRVLSLQAGLIRYRRVDSRTVRNRVRSLPLADVTKYLAMKAKLAPVPVAPAPMTTSVMLI